MNVTRLAFFLVIPLLCQCGKNRTEEAAYLEGETQRIELEQKLRLLEFRWEQRGPEVEHADAMIEVAKEAQVTTDQMRNLRTEIQSAIVILEKEVAQARKDDLFRKRAMAQGRQMETFVTKSRTYKDVTIKSVSDAGLEIKHSSGSSRVTPMQLEVAQQEEFGLSVSNALAALAEESRLQKQYTDHVDRMVAAQKQKDAIRAEAEEYARQASERAAKIAAAYRTASRSALAQTKPTTVYRVRPRSSSSTYYYYYNNSCSNTNTRPVSPPLFRSNPTTSTNPCP